MFTENPEFNDAWWVALVVVVVITMYARDKVFRNKIKNIFKRLPF